MNIESMIIEIVVWGSQGQRNVDLKQTLPHGVGFLNEAHLHFSDATFRRGERCNERWIEHQIGARPLGLVRCLGVAGRLTRELERERRLPVSRGSTPMVADPVGHAVGAADIQGLLGFGQKVHTSPRHAFGESGARHRRHSQQPLECRRQSFNVESKGVVHCESIVLEGGD